MSYADLMQARFVQAEYCPHQGDREWRTAHAVYPDEPFASARAIVEGVEMDVAYGWRDGRAVLCRTNDDDLRRGRPDVGQVIAELSTRPVELDGPKARWRWRVTT